MQGVSGENCSTMKANFMKNAELFPRWMLPNEEDLRALKELTVLLVVEHSSNTGCARVVWEKGDAPFCFEPETRKDES